MRAAIPLLLCLSVAGCIKPGDTISYVELDSDTYGFTAPDGAMTLTLDVDAGTYALALAGGDSVEGTLSVLETSSWTTCCYINGSGHSKFETVSLSGEITLGGLDLQAPHVSADGPTLFDNDGEIPEEADYASESYALVGS